MANNYVDIGTQTESALVADLQVNDGLTWDGKFYYALNSNDLIKSDPVAGEISRVTLAPASGGTFVGIASIEKNFFLLDDDGAGTMRYAIIDYAGNILKGDKMNSTYKRLTFLDKYFYTIRRDQYVSQIDVNGVEQRVDLYDTGATNACGIANDGKYIYVAVEDDGSIHKIDTTGNLIMQFFPPSAPIGRGDLTFNGRFLVDTV